MKICTKCKKEKNKDQFYVRWGQRRSRCIECESEDKRKYAKTNRKKVNIRVSKYRKTLSGKFQRWMDSAKRRGLSWEIEFEDIKDIPLVCYYSGIPLTLETNQLNSVSLDRVDSLKGYEKNNIVFCSVMVNKMKLNFEKNLFIETCIAIAKNQHPS